MTLMTSIWITATVLAASSDDGRIAASDGTAVWVSLDSAATWQRILSRPAPSSDDEEPRDPDDEHDDGALPAVLSLAILGEDVLVATASGLFSHRAGRGTSRRSSRVFVALAASEKDLWAVEESWLYRSRDGGKTFGSPRLLPTPVTSLGVTAATVVVTGPEGLFVAEGDRPFRRAGAPALAVAATPDGALIRTTASGIDRSQDGHRWVRISPVRARAIAATSSHTWIAAGQQIVDLARLSLRPRPHVSVPFDLDESIARAERARYWPRLDVVIAFESNAEFASTRAFAVMLSLVWELDAPPPSSDLARTALALWEERR